MDYKSIPIFKATISDDECGMLAISLVDYPAVERDFLAFAKAEAKPVMYSVQDDDKHLVSGVVMRADFPIYRRDESGFEYYVVYDASTIREMAEKYLVEGRQNIVDLNHDGNFVDGVHLVQYFIKDASKGICPAGFEDIEDGSLFGEFHITNEDIWAEVKAGTYRGFSLEGLFSMEDSGSSILTQARAVWSKFKQLRKNDMSKFKDIMAQLGKMLAAYGQVNTDKGVLAWDGDEDLKEGDAVSALNEQGEQVAAADGEYVTEDNKVIVVVDGKVSEIRDAEAEVAPEVEAEVEAETEVAAEAEAEPAPEAEPEAEPEEDKMADLEKRMAEIEALVARMAEALGMLDERMSKLSKEPAAKPAAEEFKAEVKKAENETYLGRILAARKK